ncbi:MAG: alpha-2-macroglobulin family protein, partial [Pseudomonadota bacterium]|nr:alpha-2-macroglobulin family protein [Pseudomonadota bacterium]
MRGVLFRVLAVLLLAAAPAFAAEKAFKNDELTTETARFETRVKEARTGGRPAAAIRADAETALNDGDARRAVELYKAAINAAPREWSLWLDLARALIAIETDDWRERDLFPRDASAAAFAGYQRAPDAAGEAEALAVLGEALAKRRMWRLALDAYKASLALDNDETVRNAYDELRKEHGFRIVDYTVDSDAASPRACVQFSEDLAKGRTDFAPFVVLEGAQNPGITADKQQICVEGLRHGQRYTLTVRTGVPSAIGERLEASRRFEIYVRDRKPLVRFTGRNYVLPRTGQKGIPVLSVNTPVVEIRIYRVGDRSLARTVLDGGFQKQLDQYALEKLADETGALVWSGEMPVASPLNEEVTTAFPVDEAVGRLEPGVYAMAAWPKDRQTEDHDEHATQWFIVSDLGLSALSGQDGIQAMIRSLASAEARAGIETRLLARNGEILATRNTDAEGLARFEPGLTRGQGGNAPAVLIAAAPDGDYAFLDLTQSPFDLSDRGVAGREAPGPLHAYVFTERGVYRPGETVWV